MNYYDIRIIHPVDEYNQYTQQLTETEFFHENVILWETAHHTNLTRVYGRLEEINSNETKLGYDKWIMSRYVVSAYNKVCINTQIRALTRSAIYSLKES
jgi:hypothetical protein